jgi:HrpA-like RNA helicase
MTAEDVPASTSTLATWSALCKDCRNRKLSQVQTVPRKKSKKKRDLEQELFEYSESHAVRQLERGMSRSDRCPECRKSHRRQIAAFPVAYVDITSIGEASAHILDPELGPTGPLGGLGPLPQIHNRRAESVDLKTFALGLQDDDILELIEKLSHSQVVVLEAGTGTGKSTLAPFRLMNPPEGAAYRPTDIGPIIVTEPRVPATTEVAKFVGEALCFGHDPTECTRHIGPGHPVGYQAEGKKVWDEACSLIYVTDGTMINWILNGELARIGTVIVDEAHERSENIDAILALLAAQLPRHPHLRVVIASATIDKTYFMRFFEQTPSVRVDHQYVEATKTVGYGVPLFSDLDFDEDILANGLTVEDSSSPSGVPMLKLPGWSEDTVMEEGGASLREVTRDRLLGLRTPAKEWPKNVDQAAANQAFNILEATDVGDVLVFLPNQRMVDNAKAFLSRRLEEQDWATNIDVYWLMKASPRDEKQRALAECEPGRRKVVIASNLAETSLTIAGIRYVVDSGLVNQAKWDPDLAISSVPLSAHSQSGIRQRWGRVGRTSHGWVFPLYTLQQFLEMPRDTPAGSTQTNLESFVLKMLAAGEDPSRLAFPADFEAPDVVRDSYAQESAQSFTQERQRATAALMGNGAVTSDGKRLTRMGAELTRSRLPSEQAIALMYADRLACVPEVATALVALGSGRLAGPGKLLASDPEWPIEWNVQARRCHEALAAGARDDLDLVIRLFSLSRAAPDRGRWCSQWWINEEALDQFASDAAKLMESLAPGMSKEATRPLDTRLTWRARAVLSRGLLSLRYVRDSENAWKSANPAQSELLAVSSFHLVPPPGEFIALARERPWSRSVATQPAEAYGLVEVVDWAISGEPSDFDLLVRVRDRIRNDDGQIPIPLDPYKAARDAYPIGSAIRLTPSGKDSREFAIEKLTEGLVKPSNYFGSSSWEESASNANDGSAAYTSESKGFDETSASYVDQPDIAGTEVAQEEVRVTPVDIRTLEVLELEDLFDQRRPSPSHPDTLTSDEQLEDEQLEQALDVELTVALPSSTERNSWTATVTGYKRGTADRVILLADPKLGTPTETREYGARIAVKAGELVPTHHELCRVMRTCDADGQVDGAETMFLSGTLLDDAIGDDAAAVGEGSTWTARIIAGQRKHEDFRLNISDGILEKLVVGRGSPRSLASHLATVTDRSFVDWRGRTNHIVRLDLDDDFAPHLPIIIDHFVKSGVIPRPGLRIRVELSQNVYARRSGTWRSEDIETLIEQFPSKFTRAKGNGRLQLLSREVLSEDDLQVLTNIEPGNEVYERNAWLLWETSRRLSAKAVSAIAEASVPAAVAKDLRRRGEASELQRHHDVGIKIANSGHVILTGNAENVATALQRLSTLVEAPSPAVQLTHLPEGPRPRFPSYDQTRAALQELGPQIVQKLQDYNERRGILTLPRIGEVDTDSVIGTLSTKFSYFSMRFVFSEPRGFYAFQKKERWESFQAETATPLHRWIVEKEKVWQVASSEPTALATVERLVRSILARVPVEISEITESRPTLIEIVNSAGTPQLEVTYDPGPMPLAEPKEDTAPQLHEPLNEEDVATAHATSRSDTQVKDRGRFASLLRRLRS